MKKTFKVKSTSYLKNKTADLICRAKYYTQSFVLNKFYEVKDIKNNKKTQEGVLLMRLLALSDASMRAGKVQTVRSAFITLRSKLNSSG